MTDYPNGLLTAADYQERLQQAADSMVAATQAGPLDAIVPACPGWTLRDLVVHLGEVHQWARANLLDGAGAARHTAVPPSPDEDLSAWYRRCFDELAEVLASTDPAAPAWTMQPSNRTAGFWSRRQCHELAMHVVDARQAQNAVTYYEPDLAVDGLAEIFDVWVYRRAAWQVPPVDLPAPVEVSCTDRDARWVLVPTGSAEPPEYEALGPTPGAATPETAAVLRGESAQLLLMLWGSADLSAVEIDGDAELVRRLLDSRITP
ncbi:maleylpyruvate isomerase family mycothiol-dependent enzyme [Nocardia blacklockiae]|uniref:maleylpyruvate isomerase family mycothiol-dependent enzyme n=1 Tax=Nocardia blacklockiae TaxID=480036 RepID=UPI00189359D1|nr:maleylpyruvate isomerase family mycothiol-dependent enzyme [Nocardia blacklockiae]MBF6172440.1 maleylpyruvate isomerase family mycothiol-dependent enzyme [Nocardia blacklockiae]